MKFYVLIFLKLKSSPVFIFILQHKLLDRDFWSKCLNLVQIVFQRTYQLIQQI